MGKCVCPKGSCSHDGHTCSASQNSKTVGFSRIDVCGKIMDQKATCRFFSKCDKSRNSICQGGRCVRPLGSCSKDGKACHAEHASEVKTPALLNAAGHVHHANIKHQTAFGIVAVLAGIAFVLAAVAVVVRRRSEDP